MLASLIKHRSIPSLWHRKAKSKDGEVGNKAKDGGRSSKTPRGPAALKKLIAFLLPLAGKRILVMLALAVARTALSNRLARVQVQADSLSAKPSLFLSELYLS